MASVISDGNLTVDKAKECVSQSPSARNHRSGEVSSQGLKLLNPAQTPFALELQNPDPNVITRALAFLETPCVPPVNYPIPRGCHSRRRLQGRWLSARSLHTRHADPLSSESSQTGAFKPPKSRARVLSVLDLISRRVACDKSPAPSHQ